MFLTIFAAQNHNLTKMKKIVFLLLALVGTLGAQAEDYTYLTFETTDGAKASVSISSLTLTINGTTLTAGSRQFTLSNLIKMYFSTFDESTTDIKTIEQSKVMIDESTAIYDLQGHKVAKSQMRKGVYIIQTKQGTYKVAIK